ncbi:M15 family metallopeptidase [Mycolicibacterium litorale]|nr:M15 family metallopeptidase [Mycolicibacterium litorale]
MVDQGSCRWVRIPGAEHVSLQIREGQPEKILRAFAADFHAYVEPLRDADSACWTATNSVASSNHLSGTAMDLNWNGPDGRTFRLGLPEERAFPPPKNKVMRELLAFYEGTLFWGADWSIRDSMHVQCSGNTYGSANFERVEDFIRRKIRPDGFSTYKRGGAPAPPPPPPQVDVADVLARATGVTIGKAREILPGVINGLRESQCSNVNRIAMWLAQMGHESAGFNATEEYASGAAYEGRRDLGNTQPGDGVRFKGRSWIQVTGRSNYTQLSKWAHSKGAVPTPTFFVDEPAKLAQIQYAGLGPAWYWTVARPDINTLSDRRDLLTVTKRINGGTNGLQDRQNRYNRALALGDQLLTLIGSSSGDDELTPEQDQMLRAIFREQTQKHPSRSALRKPGEGVVDTWAGMDLNMDGNMHFVATFLRAWLGHPKTLAELREVADNTDPARQDDAQLAQAILATTAEKPKPVMNVGTITSGVDTTAVVEAVRSAVAEAEPKIIYTAEPAPADFPTAGSTGQRIGQLVDAVEQMRLSERLSPQEAATLKAVISILEPQTKDEGAQQ